MTTEGESRVTRWLNQLTLDERRKAHQTLCRDLNGYYNFPAGSTLDEMAPLTSIRISHSFATSYATERGGSPRLQTCRWLLVLPLRQMKMAQIERWLFGVKVKYTYFAETLMSPQPGYVMLADSSRIGVLPRLSETGLERVNRDGTSYHFLVEEIRMGEGKRECPM